MKKFILPIIIVSIFSLALLPSLALAQGALDRLGEVQATADLPDGSLESTVGTIINIVLSLVGVILVVLIVYAGFLWMTAGGNEDNVKTAKTILKNAIIGLIVTLLAYGIASFVLTNLLDATM